MGTSDRGQGREVSKDQRSWPCSVQKMYCRRHKGPAPLERPLGAKHDCNKIMKKRNKKKTVDKANNNNKNKLL